MDSQVLYFHKQNHSYVDAFKKICAVYEKSTDIKDPFSERTLANFMPVIAGLHQTPNFKDLGMGRGIMLFVAFYHIWEKYKQEYNFDEYFANELSEMHLPENLPIDVLKHPPYSILYIKDPVKNEISDGWFFLLENETLLIMALKDEINAKVNIKTWALNFQEGSNIKNILRFDKRDGIESLQRALSLYLYLCSQEPEVNKSRLVRSAIKSGKIWIRKEANVSDVGVRIGRFLKESQRDNGRTPSGDKTASKSVVGHIRRAHWHHYWVGKKSEGQQAILKWIHPVLVNKGEKKCKVNVVG